MPNMLKDEFDKFVKQDGGHFPLQTELKGYLESYFNNVEVTSMSFG